MTDENIDKKVDNDWKRRAQMEKAQLDTQARAAAPQRGPAGPAAPAGRAEEYDEEAGGAEPTLFTHFLSTLASQAVVFLGLEPDPVSGQRRPNLEQARYLIDVLATLEEKTRGNLAPDEDKTMKMILHELRMAFVEVTTPRRPMPPPPGARR